MGARKRKREATDLPEIAEAQKLKRAQRDARLSATITLAHTGTSSEVVVHSNGTPKVKKSKKSKTSGKKEKKNNKESWTISSAFGGRFLDIDPIFTPDERHLMLATANAVHIYSTPSSLRVSSLPMSISGTISACAISASDSKILYVGTSSGRIYEWDWTKGATVGFWEIGVPIGGLATASADGSVDTVYVLERGESCRITAHRLRRGEGASKNEVNVILATRESIHSFVVLGNGEYLVAVSANELHVSRVRNYSAILLREHKANCWTSKSSEGITAMDARLRSPPKSSKSKGSQEDPSLDIATGVVSGAIFFYEDILSKMNGLVSRKKEKERRRIQGSLLAPRIMHWHREAVGAVRWSKDGNYLMSGGRETVLQQWQLETGKRQDLPHLTTAIDGLVVSPSGTRYALRLADNSVIVLSTSELAATSYIAGIQARTFARRNHFLPRVETVDTLGKRKQPFHPSYTRTPSTLHPLRPKELLLAVPATQSRFDEPGMFASMPYLQTFDIVQERHLSRQALTRNNATIVATGPEKNRLVEPDLTLLKVSEDGMWLATVEEWMPPAPDIDYLARDDNTVRSEQVKRREVYLKFWHWDTKHENWTLETRIDAPHRLPGRQGAGRIFDLAANPSEPGFATIGEDYSVRIWRPKTRIRDGTIVRGTNAECLVTWSLRRAVELEHEIEPSDEADDVSLVEFPVTGRLAFSKDGSVIAAAQSFRQEGIRLVHLINATEGTIALSRADLFSSPLSGIGILGSHLIVLSKTLVVWDMVANEVKYGFALDLTSSIPQAEDFTQLTVNESGNTFAISLPAPPRGHEDGVQLPLTDGVISSLRADVFIFSPSSPAAVNHREVRSLVTSLLAVPGWDQYVILDAAAQIRVLGPARSSSTINVAPKSTLALRGTEALGFLQTASNGDFLLANSAKENGVNGKWDEEEIDGADRPVVRSQTLEDFFQGPSHALPPVKDLFDGLFGLYTGKKVNA
ncbi:hypothetical protein BDY21DRAFT_285383 [Lineolata rhizophorae]|uniref:Uncharacterized protein n=1 Tax=Lineolata rhizophorae TaxID=578093 RepID=A0A6A6P2K4_9PEZI|nr:hypothetical protein BDY21DRAFT_285383 [Lineolata rhizophorae]